MPRTETFFSHLPAQRFQRAAAFFAVIPNIERNPVIRTANMVCNQAGQILKRIQRFAPVADDKADILTVKNQKGTVLFPPDINRRT